MNINPKNAALVCALALALTALSASAQNNPAVVSQSVDYPLIHSIDAGADYLDAMTNTPPLSCHISAKGEVSVGYTTNTHTFVLEFSKELKYVKAMKFENEWDLEFIRKSLLGDPLSIQEGWLKCVFTKDDDGNYYFFHARAVKDDEKNAENMVIVKYDPSGKKLNTFKLAANKKNAKRPNPHRMEIAGDMICVFFGRTMFIGSDGINHQGSTGFMVDKNTFELLGNTPPTSSHSMGRALLPVEGGFLLADHGDGNPRSFQISKMTKSHTTALRAFTFKKGSAYQITFAQMGGVAQTSSGMIFAGSYEKNTITTQVHNDSRNVFVLSADNGTGGVLLRNLSQPIWITNYSDKTKENAASVKIAALDDERVLLMWEVIGYDGYKSTYMTIVDKAGKRLIPDKELPNVRLNIGDALRYNKSTGNVYWTINNSDAGISVYAFNPDKPINIAGQTGTPTDGYGLTLRGFVSEKKSAQQNELFNLRATFNNVLWDTLPAGRIGAVLVDNGGKIVEVIGTDDQNSFTPSNYQASNSAASGSSTIGAAVSYLSSSSIKAFVPETVKPGAYTLRIAYRPYSKEEWRIVALSEGTDASLSGNGVTAIPFTVTAQAESKAGITLERFSPRKTDNVIREEAFIVACQPKNTTADTLKGWLGVALMDNAGKVIEIIGSKNLVSGLRPMSSSGSHNIKCEIPRTVKIGTYTIRIAFSRDGKNWEAVTRSEVQRGARSAYSLTVIDSKATVEDYGLILKSFEVKESATAKTALKTIPVGENFYVGYQLGYTEDNALRFKGDVGVALVDKNDNLAAFILTRSNYISGAANNQFVPRNVLPGEYRVRVAIRPMDKEWKVVSRTSPGVSNDLHITAAPALVAYDEEGDETANADASAKARADNIEKLKAASEDKSDPKAAAKAAAKLRALEADAKK